MAGRTTSMRLGRGSCFPTDATLCVTSRGDPRAIATDEGEEYGVRVGARLLGSAVAVVNSDAARTLAFGPKRAPRGLHTRRSHPGERESDVLDGRNTARLPMRLGSTYARAEMGAACPR